jgi:hypothetical protein
VVRVIAQLAAQPGDVHVQRLRRRPPFRVPDLAHDLLAGHHFSRVAQQYPEEVELLGGEVKFGVTVPSAACLVVDPHPADGAWRLDDASPQERPDAGEQLGEPERLRDVVVGARVQADDRVNLVGPGGEDQDGHRLSFGPDASAHL